MKRRSKVVGRAGKAGRRKAATPQRQSSPKSTRKHRSVATAQETEVARLTRELHEAQEQQVATAEVLKIISASPSALQPVLEVVARSAAQFCEADDVTIFELDEQSLYAAAHWGAVPQDIGVRFPCTRGHVAGRTVIDGKPVHVLDLQAEVEEFPEGSAFARRLGHWTTAGVPLLREGMAIGTIQLRRAEINPFTDKQIALLEIFAAQAVIAIENTRLLNELRQRTDDLTESLEQQTATSEVLKVISSSTGVLEPVFQAMLENAARICDAEFGVLFLIENGLVRPASKLNVPSKLDEFFNSRGAFLPPEGSPLRQTLKTKEVVHVADDASSPRPSPAAVLGNARTNVTVPMLKEGELIGAVAIFRQEVRPFTDKQIAVVQNFASQAVIAIENARLLNELRQRTDDLTESLEQQTATSEVLKVISSSPGVLEPVFNAMIENATRLCGAEVGTFALYEGSTFRGAAVYGHSERYADVVSRSYSAGIGAKAGLAQMEATRRTVQVADAGADAAYDDIRRLNPDFGRIKTALYVPIVKESDLIGAFMIYRHVVRSFTDKQIELVQNFAAQAVIAIENTRLLNELRESLQQQTATADVLKVISRSTFDLRSVLDTLTASAALLCEADKGAVMQQDGDVLRLMSNYGYPREVERYALEHPLRLERGSVTGRAALEGRPFHVANVFADPEYQATGYQQAMEYRTILGIPLMREGTAIGTFTLTRKEVKPFTEKQIGLVTTFAAQAVIAIENARLLNELRQSLRQQTATADVLKVISRSTFDLKSVLNTLVESAAQLCEAEMASIPRLTSAIFDHFASYGYSPGFHEFLQNNPTSPGRGTVSGRAVLEGRTVHIPDVLADPEYDYGEGQKAGGYRTLLGVPLMRESVAIGALVLGRSEPRPFTTQQIELAETFADQAVIAIENVRLFEAEQERTRELAKSLEELRTTQDRLVQTEKLASLGQLTAGIAHEIKNPLNFVNNFSGISTELIGELQDTLSDISIDSNRRAELKELTDTLHGNLEKVVQHGKRADAIVKSMLLHSGETSGEHRPTDINALVDESLTRAYYNARAEQRGFAIKLEKAFDPASGEVDLFPREITRALLNLISNGFYAATRRSAEAKGGDHEPTLVTATRSLGDRVEIRIRDNGNGIPADVKEKMFDPFFTTKPTGEGTGLGLSISHDIIVKQHGGSIEVDTVPGEFAEFRVILPRSPSG